MKKILLSFTAKSFFFFLLLLPQPLLWAEEASTYTQSQETLKQMIPSTALKLLQEGNTRFVDGKMKHRNFLQQAKLTEKGQYPFAFILSCMDSRSSPEILFDQGIGDVFVGRVAGNVISDDQLASMEYATQVVGSHLIVLMGHTACGAVKGACENVNLGHLTGLIKKITPAVNTVKQKTDASTLDCNNHEIIDAIVKQNVLNMMHQVQEKSPVIKKLIAQKKVMLIGAVYDLATGKVNFFQP